MKTNLHGADLDTGLALRQRQIAELAAHPEALRWAENCGWLPGTGHCGNRTCSSECLFRTQCDVDADRVRRARRARRPTQHAFAARMARLAGVLFP